MNLLMVGVVVNDSLVVEVGVIVLSIEFEGVAEKRNAERGADAVVPSRFLRERMDDESATVCQEIVVFSQCVNGSIALSCR